MTLLRQANLYTRSGRFDEAVDAYQELKRWRPELSGMIDANLSFIERRKALLSAQQAVSNQRFDVGSSLDPNSLDMQSTPGPTVHLDSEKLRYGDYFFWPNSYRGISLHGGQRLSTKKKCTLGTYPLVSIITTVFNRELVIERCINSVLQQTYPNIEHIIIDGLSSDGTLEVVQRYKQSVDYYISEVDGGIYEGMNKGLSLAQGSYALILNSDDWLVNNAIEKLVHSAITNDVDIVAAKLRKVDANGYELSRLGSKWNALVYLSSPARHGAMLISDVAYLEVGLYDQSKKVLADRLWMQQAYESGIPTSIIEDCVTNFSATGVSSSGGLLHEREKREEVRLICPDVTFEDETQLLSPSLLSKSEIQLMCSKYYRNSTLVKALSVKRRQVKFGVTEPIITVQIPVMNAASDIDQCLESILSQKNENIEVICVDMGSEDDSYDRILGAAKNDSRILAYKLKENEGLVQARSKTFLEATGDYMIFVDTADILSQDALASLCDLINSDEVDFIQFRSSASPWGEIFNQSLTKSIRSYLGSGLKLKASEIVLGFPDSVQSNLSISCVRKSVFKRAVKKFPQDTKLQVSDDLWMFLIAYYANSFRALNKTLYSYRPKPIAGSVTTPNPEFAEVLIREKGLLLQYISEFLYQESFSKPVPSAIFPKVRSITVAHCEEMINRCGERYPESVFSLNRAINLFPQS